MPLAFVVPIDRGALPLPFTPRPHQLRRHVARRLEEQLLLAVLFDHFDRDRVLAGELALEQLLGERVFDQVFDGPTQRRAAELLDKIPLADDDTKHEEEPKRQPARRNVGLVAAGDGHAAAESGPVRRTGRKTERQDGSEV